MNTRPTPNGDRFRWLPLAMRRRFPRFVIDGAFAIEDVVANKTVGLMDVSVGGFRSTSTVDLRPGTVRTFRFPLGPVDQVTLSASVVHCYPVHGATDEFTIGWTWVDPPVNVEGVPVGVLAIVDFLTSERSPVDIITDSATEDSESPDSVDA